MFYCMPFIFILSFFPPKARYVWFEATCWKRSPLPASACSSVTCTTDSTPSGRTSSCSRGASWESTRTSWKFNENFMSRNPVNHLEARMYLGKTHWSRKQVFQAVWVSGGHQEVKAVQGSFNSGLLNLTLIQITTCMLESKRGKFWRRSCYQQGSSFGFVHVAKSHEETTFSAAIWKRHHRGQLGSACGKGE